MTSTLHVWKLRILVPVLLAAKFLVCEADSSNYSLSCSSSSCSSWSGQTLKLLLLRYPPADQAEILQIYSINHYASFLRARISIFCPRAEKIFHWNTLQCEHVVAAPASLVIDVLENDFSGFLKWMLGIYHLQPQSTSYDYMTFNCDHVTTAWWRHFRFGGNFAEHRQIIHQIRG